MLLASFEKVCLGFKSYLGGQVHVVSRLITPIEPYSNPSHPHYYATYQVSVAFQVAMQVAVVLGTFSYMMV